MSYSLRQRMSLKGRVAVITGSANILGPQFAAALAEFGAQLALVDIDGERCERVAREIRESHGTGAIAIEADVANEQAVSDMVRQVQSDFGRIDVLVNAAATKSPHYFEQLEDYDLADWNEVMAVNLTGAFLCAKHVVPHFVRESRGNIINIASVYGVVGPDPKVYDGSWYMDQEINTPAVYAASKGGMVNFTRYLATTLAQHNVRANCITPGGVFSGQNDSFVERYGSRVPMGRMARREELQGALLFLASDASSYVTGHNLVVDGGMTAW